MTPLSFNRRRFLQTAGVLTAGLVTPVQTRSARAADSPNNKIVLAVMGTNGRGMDHIAGFLGQPNTEIANWHWHWHWGDGELGNNGIHALDVARWGLQAEYPKTVTCTGGRYQDQDDQETPDVYVTAFDFGDKGATWESHSCHLHGFDGEGFGINFYCDRGCLSIAGNQARIYDSDNKVIGEIKGSSAESLHYANFLGCIRSGERPNSEIGEGAKSTLLCHLGNIAYRSGRALHCDPQTGRILGDKQTEQAYWSREYRPGWEPKV